MDGMSFAVGMCAGVITTMGLLVLVVVIYARPFFQAARRQRETQDQLIKTWADKLSEAGRAQSDAHKNPKWGGGNS